MVVPCSVPPVFISFVLFIILDTDETSSCFNSSSSVATISSSVTSSFSYFLISFQGVLSLHSTTPVIFLPFCNLILLLVIFDRRHFITYSSTPFFNLSSPPVVSYRLILSLFPLQFYLTCRYRRVRTFIPLPLTSHIPPLLLFIPLLSPPLCLFNNVLSVILPYFHCLIVCFLSLISSSFQCQPFLFLCHPYISVHALFPPTASLHLFPALTLFCLLLCPFPAPTPSPPTASSSLPEVLATGPSLPVYIGINLPHHTITLLSFFQPLQSF